MKSPLFLLLPLYLLAGELTLSKTSSVSLPPNQATLSLAIITENATAEEAIRENRTQSEALFALIKKLNLQASTEQFQLFPMREGEEKRVRFHVVNQLRVTTKELDTLGKLIDQMGEAGASQINQLTFSNDDPKEARKQAIERAVSEAKQEAEILATAAGLTLTEIKKIELDGNVSFQPVMLAKSTSILPSDLEISATVTLTFKVE